MYATIGSIGTYTTLPMYICKQLCTYALILVRLLVRILHSKAQLKASQAIYNLAEVNTSENKKVIQLILQMNNII